MGRLSNLGGGLSTLAPRLARQSDQHGHSKAAEPWRAWFGLKRWRDLRLAVFQRDAYTCRMTGCGRIAPSPLLVADHTIPHRGDAALFWDPDNLQTLCKPCHDAIKQRAERRAAARGEG